MHRDWTVSFPVKVGQDNDNEKFSEGSVIDIRSKDVTLEEEKVSFKGNFLKI